MFNNSFEVLTRIISRYFYFIRGVAKSFRFRLFLFILFIYVAGATLDVTNTNPGSRFMLTKAIAKYGEFEIHEEDRYRYSYLDYSLVNTFLDASFEDEVGINSENWKTFNASKLEGFSRSGNHSIQIQADGGWIEQDIIDVEVYTIYEYLICFWGAGFENTNSNLTVTVYFTDQSLVTHRVAITTNYYVKHQISLVDSRDKSIDKIRFYNSDPGAIQLDDFSLDKIYSDKPPGLSLLTVPIYWIGEFLAVTLFGINIDDNFMIDDIVKFLIIISVLILGAFTAIKFYDLLRLLGVSHSSANMSTLVFAFGSLFYVYIGTFFSHGIIASFVLLALYHCTKFRQTKEISSLIWSSFFSGYAVVCDLILLFFIPFYLCYILIPFPWNIKDIISNWKQYLKIYLPTIGLYFIPIIICGLLVMFYNFTCFDDPFKSPYAYAQAQFFRDNQHFANSMFEGLEVLIFSGQHGLIHFMPIVFVGVIGLIPMFKKAPALASLCITLPLWHILLYSKYFFSAGGLAYGPRHIVSIIPMVVIPLGFLLDLEETGSLVQRMGSVLIKSLCVFLGMFSLLINIAGAWIGVYPLGGEGMVNPIWGSDEQAGHITAFLSSFQFSFDLPGQVLLDILTDGISLSGLKFSFLVATFQLKLSGPFASSLARSDTTAFIATLLLALLVNPYFSPLDWCAKLSRKVKEFYSTEKRYNPLVFYLILEGTALLIFIVWIFFEFLPLYGIRDFIATLWEILRNGFDIIDSIPIINILSGILGFISYSILNLIVFRYEAFSVSNWFLNVLLFISVTSVAWIPFNQLERRAKKTPEDLSNNPSANDNEELTKSRLFQGYRYVAMVLALAYMSMSLYTIIFKGSAISFYSNIADILYFSIFFLTLIIARIPFTYRNSIVKDGSTYHSDVKLSHEDQNSAFESGSYSVVSLLILTILFLNIIGRMIINQFSPFELIFIIPNLVTTSVKDWFIRGKNPVLVFLGLGLILEFIILCIPIYQLGTDAMKLPKTLPKLPRALEKELESNYIGLSSFQSIIIFGGGLLTLVFLLISVLFSVLSTVPNPSILKQHFEEWIIWYSIFILFFIGYILGNNQYRKHQVE